MDALSFAQQGIDNNGIGINIETLETLVQAVYSILVCELLTY